MPDVLVLGAGANGLACAITLRQRGHRVRVWHRDPPATTVSAVAGAIWHPFLAEPRERLLGWCRTTFRVLRALTEVRGAGVHMQPIVETFAEPEPDLWWAAAAGPIERLPAAQVPPPARAAIRTTVPVCDTTRHLPWLRAEAERLGVAFAQRAATSLDEALAECPTVVHCTGLGAAALCGDRDLQPVRGQVLLVDRVALPHGWIDCSGPQPVYVVPREGDLLLGATAQPGDARTEADAADTARVLAAAVAAMPQLAQANVRAVRVGLRPWRSSVRLEVEPRPAGRIVHDYGHGGSGYTLNWGCAAEVARLVGG